MGFAFVMSITYRYNRIATQQVFSKIDMRPSEKQRASLRRALTASIRCGFGYLRMVGPPGCGGRRGPRRKNESGDAPIRGKAG